VLLFPRSGGAKKNSPHYRAEAVPHQIRLAQTVLGFIRLHSSKTCIFLRPVCHTWGTVLHIKFQSFLLKIKVYDCKAQSYYFFGNLNGKFTHTSTKKRVISDNQDDSFKQKKV
jgi:hypothetical protein